ncbi:POTRA domain-containing protein [Actinobacillus seminis]|nr:POTRA domain-containing protein [Actinobacillus seminis]
MQKKKKNLSPCVPSSHDCTDGINVLVKTIQNKIIEKGYVTTRVVVPEKILPMVNLI